MTAQRITIADLATELGHTHTHYVTTTVSALAKRHGPTRVIAEAHGFRLTVLTGWGADQVRKELATV